MTFGKQYDICKTIFTIFIFIAFPILMTNSDKYYKKNWKNWCPFFNSGLFWCKSWFFEFIISNGVTNKQ